jgi:hypothetical protein
MTPHGTIIASGHSFRFVVVFYTDTINISGHTATNENNQDCGVGVV